MQEKSDLKLKIYAESFLNIQKVEDIKDLAKALENLKQTPPGFFVLAQIQEKYSLNVQIFQAGQLSTQHYETAEQFTLQELQNWVTKCGGKFSSISANPAQDAAFKSTFANGEFGPSIKEIEQQLEQLPKLPAIFISLYLIQKGDYR